jgi:hypothetical protein
VPRVNLTGFYNVSINNQTIPDYAFENSIIDIIEINNNGSQYYVSDYQNNTIVVLNSTLNYVASKKFKKPSALMNNCERILFQSLRDNQFEDNLTNISTNYTSLLQTTIGLRKLNEILLYTIDNTTNQTVELQYGAYFFDWQNTKFYFATPNNTITITSYDLGFRNSIDVYPYNVTSFASFDDKIYASTDDDKFLVLFNNTITNVTNSTCANEGRIRKFSIDSSGYIIFPCYSNQTVAIINQSGTEIRPRINTPGLNPHGVLLDSGGKLFVYGEIIK